MKYLSERQIEFIFDTYTKSVEIYGKNQLPEIKTIIDLKQLDILTLLKVWDCCLIYIIDKSPELDYCLGWTKIEFIGFISCQLHNMLEDVLKSRVKPNGEEK